MCVFQSNASLNVRYISVIQGILTDTNHRFWKNFLTIFKMIKLCFLGWAFAEYCRREGSDNTGRIKDLENQMFLWQTFHGILLEDLGI